MSEVGFHPHAVLEMAVNELNTHREITCPLKADIFKCDVLKTNVVEMNVLEGDIFEVHVRCQLVVHVAVLPAPIVDVTISPLRGKVGESVGPHGCVKDKQSGSSKHSQVGMDTSQNQ